MSDACLLNRDEAIELQTGLMDGKEWAEKYATQPQLRRLGLAYECLALSHQNPNWDDHFDIGSGIQFTHGRDSWLAKLIKPTAEVDDFWCCAVGDDWEMLVSEPEYLRGFCDGAIEVWQKQSEA